MSVVIMDGRVRVYWLTATPANLALPTAAELNAGTNIGVYIRPDGLDISMDTGEVDVGNVTSTFTLLRVGRRKPTVMLGFHHDATTGSTDPAWTLLLYRATGSWPYGPASTLPPRGPPVRAAAVRPAP
jgi:hypothetical protein